MTVYIFSCSAREEEINKDQEIPRNRDSKESNTIWRTQYFKIQM